MRWSLMTSLPLLWPSQALAGQNGGDGLLPAAMKMLAALVVVLGIILLLNALARRKPGLFSPVRTGAIKVVETRYVGAKKALCLVEVRGEEFLLGLGQDRIELISRLDRQKSTFEETLQNQEVGR